MKSFYAGQALKAIFASAIIINKIVQSKIIARSPIGNRMKNTMRLADCYHQETQASSRLI